MYGFILTTFNDADNAIESYRSLLSTFPSGTTHKIVVVDAGSTEEELYKIRSHIGATIGPYKHLSEALNAGIYHLLGFPNNIKPFIESGGSSCEHIFWIHPDMRYYQPDWAGKLCQIYDSLWPLVGRLAPGTSNIDGSIAALQRGEYLQHSNNCPWVIGREYIHHSLVKYGWVYNPEYINCGGCEDHDTWFRMLNDGMFACVCPLVDVAHRGMGTRSLTDTNADQIHNREVFHRIWGQDIFPKIDFDLKDAIKDLDVKFGHLREEVISLIPHRDECHKQIVEGYNRAKEKLNVHSL